MWYAEKQKGQKKKKRERKRERKKIEKIKMGDCWKFDEKEMFKESQRIG